METSWILSWTKRVLSTPFPITGGGFQQLPGRVTANRRCTEPISTVIGYQNFTIQFSGGGGSEQRPAVLEMNSPIRRTTIRSSVTIWTVEVISELNATCGDMPSKRTRSKPISPQSSERQEDWSTEVSKAQAIAISPNSGTSSLSCPS